MESALKSDHAQAVTEVFHEFFKVDSLIPVDIRSETKSDDLLFGEFHITILEALNVFVDLEEPILVAVIFLEQIKEIKSFQLNVFNVGLWLELFCFNHRRFLG